MRMRAFFGLVFLFAGSVYAAYDANEVAQGVTEVLAYGTAVVVEATS